MGVRALFGDANKRLVSCVYSLSSHRSKQNTLTPPFLGKTGLKEYDSPLFQRVPGTTQVAPEGSENSSAGNRKQPRRDTNGRPRYIMTAKDKITWQNKSLKSEDNKKGSESSSESDPSSESSSDSNDPSSDSNDSSDEDDSDGSYGARPSKSEKSRSKYRKKTSNKSKKKRGPNAMPSRSLLAHQITAIVWILSRFFGVLPKLNPSETVDEELIRTSLRGPRYSGAILADSMGMGKTKIVVALLELIAGQNLHVLEGDKPGEKLHFPMLILCPNIAVSNQWVDELLDRTSTQNIHKIVVGGGTGERSYPKDKRVKYLTGDDFKSWPEKLDYIWDTSCPDTSKTVLVMPIDTWAARTYRKIPGSQPTEHYSSFGDCRFSVVCVDEAHKVKNRSTRLWKSVASLKQHHMLLLTATPCLNTLSDLIGPAHLLWQNATDYLKSNNPEVWKQTQRLALPDLPERLDKVQPWDDLQLAAGKPRLLEGMICKRHWAANEDIDIQRTKRYLSYFERLAMLKRGPSSVLFEDREKTQQVSLSRLFPAVQNQTICIKPGGDFDRLYQEAHVNMLIKYHKAMHMLKEKPNGKNTEHSGMGKGKKNGKGSSKNKTGKQDDRDHLTTIRRQLRLASSSMDAYHLNECLSNHEFGTKAKHIAEMRASDVDLRDLVACLCKYFSEEVPKTALEYLRRAIQESPVLRFILHDLQENILDRRPKKKIKKLLITESVPFLAYYYELVLAFIGLNARTFHSELKDTERQEIIDSFNSKSKKSVQVLIQMYAVGSAGTNLQKNCARVIIASQAHSFAVQAQATHRVIRVGQKRNVTVQLCKVSNTYADYLQSK